MPYLILVIVLSLIGNGVQAWLLDGASDKCALQIASLESAAAKSLASAIEAEADKARLDNQANEDRLAEVKKQLQTSKTSYRSAASAKPLPSDCRADSERVRAVNSSRAKAGTVSDPPAD